MKSKAFFHKTKPWLYIERYKIITKKEKKVYQLFFDYAYLSVKKQNNSVSRFTFHVRILLHGRTIKVIHYTFFQKPIPKYSGETKTLRSSFSAGIQNSLINQMLSNDACFCTHF